MDATPFRFGPGFRNGWECWSFGGSLRVPEWRPCKQVASGLRCCLLRVGCIGASLVLGLLNDEVCGRWDNGNGTDVGEVVQVGAKGLLQVPLDELCIVPGARMESVHGSTLAIDDELFEIPNDVASVHLVPIKILHLAQDVTRRRTRVLRKETKMNRFRLVVPVRRRTEGGWEAG